MEVLNSSSSSEKHQTKPKRKRHRKVKSNLSERLKPDFDPTGAIHQASMLKPKPLIEEQSIQDVDSIVKCYPKIIHDYLLKILQFLQSDQTELRFPDIAPFKEEFLVKIAENNSLLDHIKCRDESSVQTAKQILQHVYQNKHVYKWICKYEKEKKNKNVLVYKKVAATNVQSKRDKTLCSNESTSSIEKGLKNMSLNDDQPEITAGFKITMLNTTLKFIKDPTRVTLEYPKMSPPHAQYLYDLIQPDGDQKSDLGYGFKSMYSVLHETMDKLKDKYQFQIMFKKYTSCPDTIKLVLNKMLKMQTLKTNKPVKRKINSDSKSLNSSFTSTSSADSKSLSRSQRDYLTKQRIIAKVTDNFVTSTLQKFLDFLEDKAMASLEFKSVDVTESRFLESLITISRLEGYYCLFTPECEVMLKRISRSLRRKDWGLTLNFGKLCKRTDTRTIVFYKSPSYESKSAESQPATKNPKAETANEAVRLSNGLTATVKNDQSQNDGKVPSIILPCTSKNQVNRELIAFFNAGSLIEDSSIDNKTNMTLSGESILTQSESNATQSGSNVLQNESNATQSGPNVLQTESNTTQSGSDVIQNGSNVTQSESNMIQSESNTTQNASSPPLASRKARLLKALTTPMECDRAERMMRMMGWEGGGLGLRGEGITEPILPALHIAPGAGLGHVKTPAHNTAAEFRIKFLHDLLNFIKSSIIETETTFDQPMTKRECGFVNHTMPVFNDRRTIGLNAPEEMDLVYKINEEFLKDLHLYVTCDVSEDKKTLHLTKENGPKFSKKALKKKKKSKSKNKSNDGVASNDDVIDISETTKDIESICPTRKAAQNLAYRIKFLEKIKEFLTDKNEIVEHKYDCVINKKLGTYFENVIKDINRNVATTRFSEIENDLFREIRRNSNGCYMNVTYKDQKFTLVKRFPKNQVNPTHSLPPPKSTDLKNTIIYQNNVAIPADEFEDHLKNNINDDGHETNKYSMKHAKNKDFETFTDSIKDATNKGVKDVSIQVHNEKDMSKTDRNNDEVYDTDIPLEEYDISKDICLDISNESLMLDVASLDAKVTENEKLEHDFGEVNNNHDFKDKNGGKGKSNDFLLQINNAADNKKQTPKKTEIIRYVSIVSEDFVPISIDLVKLVQTTISDVIESMDDEILPLLKCHGIKHGGLIYSCHNEYSYYWLKNINVFFDKEIKIYDTEYSETNFKLRMRINSFINGEVSFIFNRLDLYNPELDIKEWKVLNENKTENFVEYDLALDKRSFDFISEHDFALFVGIDKAQFSILWD